MKFPWYIWIPRGLIIAVAIFANLFSYDAFEGQSSIWMKLIGYIIHNIPVIIVLLILWLTWKRPFWGGYIFGLVAAALIYFFGRGLYSFILWNFLFFVLPVLIGSVLFFLAHFKRRTT
ncbi:MAG: hypothetical protein FJ041_05240 [Candidatus Cloacimonetes bacterium]|nr:hypothetical protein [Candidatus Cloacimonadota bacterium]